MGNDLILTPEAEKDIIEAFDWYRSRHPEVGEQFLRAVESNFDQLAESPRRFLKVHGDVRRSLLHNFPYCIFFEEMPQNIVIYAVFHTSRNPDKWKGRLT